MKKSILTLCFTLCINLLFSQETVKNVVYIDFITSLPYNFSSVGIAKATDNKPLNNAHLTIGNAYFFSPRWGVDIQYSFNRFFVKENISEEIFGNNDNFPLYNGEYESENPNNTISMFTLGPVYRKSFNKKFSLQANMNMGLFSLSSENYRAAEKIRGSNNILYKEISVPHSYSFAIQPSLQLNYTVNRIDLYVKLYYIQTLSQIETTTIDSDFFGTFYEMTTEKNTFGTFLLTVGMGIISKK